MKTKSPQKENIMTETMQNTMKLKAKAKKKSRKWSLTDLAKDKPRQERRIL